MNLGLCITNLLRRYPAVEVPGIGVFVKTHVSALYDEARSAFLPPSNRIELMERHSDGFPITVYLQAQEQVDGAAALGMLDEAVKEVMGAISSKGKACLDGLGYLFRDGASFVFEPLKIGDFDWKPIRAAIPAIGEEEVAEQATPDTAVSTEGYSVRRRATRWVIAAILLMVLGTVGVLWYYQPALFNRSAIAGFFGQTEALHPQPANQEPPAEASLLIEPEIDSMIADTVGANASIIDSTLADGTADVKIAAGKPAVTYEIIVGSFATMEQATKFLAQMKAKGYELQAINSKMPGNRKKVSWGSFATEEEAYRELSRVQKNFEPGAWIAKVVHD